MCVLCVSYAHTCVCVSSVRALGVCAFICYVTMYVRYVSPMICLCVCHVHRVLYGCANLLCECYMYPMHVLLLRTYPKVRKS